MVQNLKLLLFDAKDHVLGIQAKSSAMCLSAARRVNFED
jgi:hypothetical protein